eukprot:SAG11_NODE_29087_length_314_cov_1.655814_2_plen_51_part_01
MGFFCLPYTTYHHGPRTALGKVELHCRFRAYRATQALQPNYIHLSMNSAIT